MYRIQQGEYRLIRRTTDDSNNDVGMNHQRKMHRTKTEHPPVGSCKPQHVTLAIYHGLALQHGEEKLLSFSVKAGRIWIEALP